MSTSWFSALIIPPVHPLMAGTLFCIFGIICASFFSNYLFLFAVSIILLIILVIFCFLYSVQKLYIYTSIACLILFIAGFYRYQLCVYNYNTLKQQLIHKQARYTGVVQNLEQATHKYYKYSLTLRITHIEHNLDSVSTPIINPGYTLKYYYTTPTLIMPGDTLVITSSITQSNKKFENYLLKESVLAHVFTKNLDYINLVNAHTSILTKINNFLTRVIACTQDRVRYSLKARLSPLAYTFVSSLFLGVKPPHEHYRQSIKTACTQWGIVHYLARSGLHIVLIIALWSMIIAVLPMSYISKQVLLISVIILYYIFTWPSISFIRAFITFMLYKLCLFTNRPAHSFYTVTLTCLIVLLYNPLQLFFLDFQLSFGLTAALAWFNEVRKDIINQEHL